jgi:hypothetical protein
MSRGLRRLLAGVAAVGLVAGCARSGTTQPAWPPAATASTRDDRATPVPSRLSIPRIGVASRLDQLGRAPVGRRRASSVDRRAFRMAPKTAGGTREID